MSSERVDNHPGTRESKEAVQRVRGFENEPADEWREDYGKGGPVRSDEPERDYFFEENAIADGDSDEDTTSPPALKAAQLQRETFKGQGPRNYRPTDERIRERLCELITDHNDVDASDIALEVECGIVKLHGTVRDEAMRDRLLSALHDVHGVVGVVSSVTCTQQ